MSAWGKSWGMAWGNAWGLLDKPYLDLSHSERLYVRTQLASFFAEQDVAQITAHAESNNVSVRVASEALALSSAPSILLVPTRHPIAAQRNPASPKLLRQPPKKQTTTERELTAYVYTRQPSAVATAAQWQARVTQPAAQQLFLRS